MRVKGLKLDKLWISSKFANHKAMARAGYITLDTATEEAYYSVLRPTDRFIFPRVTKKISLISVRRKKGVSQRSLLPACAIEWAAMTQGQRDAWNAAGAYSFMSGWKLYVKDKCYRIKNELAGNATPSNFHQALVGNLHIDAPSEEIKIFQPHPYEYYVARRVTGTKSMYSPAVVQEKLTLPFEIGLSYKSDLEATGAGAFAKFYAIIRRLYQGQNLDELLEINLDLLTNWKTETATKSFIFGQYTSYQLFFHLYKVQGDLWFDNVKAYHTGQNWARDRQCNDINAVFTRAFYQIPKHWAALVLPAGAWYESVYINE